MSLQALSGGSPATSSPPSPRSQVRPDFARYVGIDLGITGHHTCVVLDQRFNPIGKPIKLEQSYEAIVALHQLLRAQLQPDAHIAWIMEPTGNAWKLLAAVLASLQESTVFVPATRKSAMARKTLSTHVKNDQIDALALAKLPLLDHRMQPYSPPSKAIMGLRLTVDLINRCARENAKVKLRLRACCQLLNPGFLPALIGDGDFSPMVKRVLPLAYDPRNIKSLKALTRLLRSPGRGPKLSDERLETLFAILSRNAQQAQALEHAHALPVELGSLRIEAEDLTAQLEAIAKRRHRLELERDRWMQELDPLNMLLTIPGLGPQSGATILAYTGDHTRFRNQKSYRGYVGMVPGSTQTGGDKPAKGRQIGRSGPNGLKQAYYLAATRAMMSDSELAALAVRLQERGLTYSQIVVAVANRLMNRVIAMMRRCGVGEKPRPSKGYIYRSPEGQVVSREQSRAEVELRYRLKTAKNPKPMREPRGEQVTAVEESSSTHEDAQAQAIQDQTGEQTAAEPCDETGLEPVETQRQQAGLTQRRSDAEEEEQEGSGSRKAGEKMELGKSAPAGISGYIQKPEVESDCGRLRWLMERQQLPMKLIQAVLDEATQYGTAELGTLIDYMGRMPIPSDVVEAQMKLLKARREHRERRTKG